MARGKKYEWNAEDAEIAKFWSMNGIQQKLIAEKLGIAEKTLRKYYKEEMSLARHEMIANITAVAYDMAMGGDRKMIELFLTRKGGWNEQVEVTVDKTITAKPMEIGEWAKKHGVEYSEEELH